MSKTESISFRAPSGVSGPESVVIPQTSAAHEAESAPSGLAELRNHASYLLLVLGF